MIAKRPLCPERVRTIPGSFAVLEHRCLRDGFWSSLSPHALLRAVFFVFVADRNGRASYSFEKICARLPCSLNDDLVARNALIHKDLLAFEGQVFQVLALPPKPVLTPQRLLHSTQHRAHADPATIRQIIRNSLGADHD